MIKSKILSLGIIILILASACKPKTDLYLERGLDILSNVKKINFNILNDVTIKEIGVIRDQKEQSKTLVLKLDKNTNELAFKKNIMIGIRVWIEDSQKNIRKENWDFKPKLIQSNGYKYLINDIMVKEDRIKKMKIYAYKNFEGEKNIIGSSTVLHKIFTYND